MWRNIILTDPHCFTIGFRVVVLDKYAITDDVDIIQKEPVAMKTICVYDPPMCCSSGVCGPSVDENLIRFTADLDWLKGQGVSAERYNLSQQPAEFVGNSLVKEALAREGNDCLPVILADGAVVHKGSYPSRRELAEYAGVS